VCGLETHQEKSCAMTNILDDTPMDGSSSTVGMAFIRSSIH
jgi:hypothetical protein